MEASSSKSISRASSTEVVDEDSPVVASSSENKLSSSEENLPESSFRDPEAVAYDYEISCPTQSSQYQGLHSDLPEMPGSSTISVSVVNSSEVPASSTLMMDQYSVPSQNSLSPESTTMLSPTMNIQVQPSSTSDGNQISVNDIRFRSSSQSPVEVASTSASIQDIPQHNKVISTSDSSNVINMVESSNASDEKEELQSSDIQPSCNAEISWQHSSASNLNPEPSTSSQNNQASHSLVC